MPNSTMPLEDRFCPKCGKWGQLKYRLKYHQVYAEIDHYQTLKGKISKLHHNYSYSCYLGNVESAKVINLLRKSKSKPETEPSDSPRNNPLKGAIIYPNLYWVQTI